MKTLMITLLLGCAFVVPAHATRETGGMDDQMQPLYSCFNQIQLADGPEIAIVQSTSDRALALRIHFVRDNSFRFVALTQTSEDASSIYLSAKPVTSVFQTVNQSQDQYLVVIAKNKSLGATVKVNPSSDAGPVYLCRLDVSNH